MNAWQGFAFVRLTEVPRHGDDQRDHDGSDEAARGLLAGLTGAHAEMLARGGRTATLVTGWVRSAYDESVRLLVGGRPFPSAVAAPARAAGQPPKPRPVRFPPGAVGVDLTDRLVDGMLAEFPYWVSCTGRPDALWAEQPDARATTRRGSFDAQVAYHHEAFAWLVLATPLHPDDLKPELDSLVNEILPLARGDISEAKRVALERKQARHRELSRWQTGFWRIRVLAGGPDRPAAAANAAMLCAASELDGQPYLLLPDGDPQPATAAFGATGGFSASTPLLAALARPPERELPGVRLVRRHSFDVTPEYPETAGIRLGDVLGAAGHPVGPLALTEGALNRHTFVCGATGSGKSQTIRHLLAQATRDQIPWLVVEPAKSEYARMASRIAGLGDVVVIRPNDPDTPPAGINPLEPAPGFPLQTHVDLLRALFLAAFEPVEPFPQVLAAALTRCYAELGWDLTLGEPLVEGAQPRYPTLGDLERTADAVVGDIGYGREVADNVRGFIKVRVGSLRLGTTGRFFEGGHPLDFDALLRRNVVLAIEDVGDDADKAFFMGVVLMRLVEHLRRPSGRPAPGSGLRHLTVIEEAHRLLRKPDRSVGAAAHAVEMFAAMLAEVRAYGEGLVIAEQIPSKLVPDVIKNTAVKVVHRLPALDDRESVGATMNLDATQSRYLVTLTPGEGAVFGDGMDRPVLVRVPDGSDAERAEAEPAPVQPLIGRRSTTCGTRCADEPCSLRQMRAAQQLLAADRWLTAWAELMVLAHLTGEPLPLPRRELLVALAARRVSARALDCAVSHAVDDAVAVRAGSLPPEVSPRALAEHVTTAVRRLLAAQDPGCGADALSYLGTPYRWELVRQALAGEPGEERHPRTAEWEARFRTRMPGETRAAQLEAVKAWMKADWEDTPRREAATYGTRRPSTLESFVGAADEDRRGRVEALLEQFVAGEWALAHLVPD